MADEEVRELIAAVKKRNFDAKERKADAKSGAAMSDGSFPIENAGDLANAMKLAGHAKDPAAARKHIKARAKALGLESHLSGAYAKAVIEQADRALRKAVEANGRDHAAYEAAITDHSEYLDGVLPAEIVKAHRAASGSKPIGDANMTAETADLKPAEAVVKEDKPVETPKANKPAKTEKSEAEVVTEPEADVKKRADDLIAKVAAQEEIIKRLEERENIRDFGKRAIGLGLDEKRGETLRKAYQGDKAAIADLETMIKGLVEAARVGKVFEEFGSAGAGSPTTAKAEMDTVVADVAKAKSISIAKAFTEVYTDPKHADLKARYDAEMSPLAKRR